MNLACIYIYIYIIGKSRSFLSKRHKSILFVDRLKHKIWTRVEFCPWSARVCSSNCRTESEDATLVNLLTQLCVLPTQPYLARCAVCALQCLCNVERSSDVLQREFHELQYLILRQRLRYCPLFFLLFHFISMLLYSVSLSRYI